jgi:hypothetical protein
MFIPGYKLWNHIKGHDDDNDQQYYWQKTENAHKDF